MTPIQLSGPSARPLPEKQDAHDEPPPKASLCQRISDAYRNAIHKFVQFLWRHGWHVTGMVLGTLLLEFCQAMKAGFLCPAGWKKQVHPTNAYLDSCR